MKKIMYELEDVAPIFLMIGYLSLAIGAWQFISHLVTLSLSFSEMKQVIVCVVFGYVFVKFSRKIAGYNDMPPHTESSATTRDNSVNDPSEKHRGYRSLHC